VIFLIKQVEKTDNNYTLVVRECTLFTRYWKVKVQHTFNSTADWLANSLGYFTMKKIVVCYVNGSYLTSEKSLMIIFLKKTSMRKEIVLGLEIFFYLINYCVLGMF
jgi:hypothetical protein